MMFVSFTLSAILGLQLRSSQSDSINFATPHGELIVSSASGNGGALSVVKLPDLTVSDIYKWRSDGSSEQVVASSLSGSHNRLAVGSSGSLFTATFENGVLSPFLAIVKGRENTGFAGDSISVSHDSQRLAYFFANIAAWKKGLESITPATVRGSCVIRDYSSHRMRTVADGIQNDGLAWSKDDSAIYIVRFENISVLPKSFKEMLSAVHWTDSSAPIIFEYNLRSKREKIAGIGEHPVISTDGDYLISSLSDPYSHLFIRDLNNRDYRTVESPQNMIGGVIAYFSDGTFIFDGVPGGFGEAPHITIGSSFRDQVGLPATVVSQPNSEVCIGNVNSSAYRRLFSVFAPGGGSATAYLPIGAIR